MKDVYKTIGKTAEGLYKSKGSKFLAFAHSVKSEDEVKNILQALRKKYHDARHNCYAYRIGSEEPREYRMNDDGEPSGTAGKPIYGQILSYDLTNILIVVVRYFGGTLLGTSGLIKAYKGAAQDCLNNAGIIKKIICSTINTRFPYEQMNQVMRIIKEEDLTITRQLADLDCSLTIQIRKTAYDRVKSRLELIDKLNIITSL